MSSVQSAPPAMVDANSALKLSVVGIGASAGGLKALQQFLEAVPADSGMAYVVILHLDPDRESRMRELLQDRTVLPVVQVDGTTVVEANRVYIIPPGHDLVMERTSLELRKRGERAEHAPVDLFFRTLALSYGANAVGVILSGTGADGTAGIRHVREAGGVTVAQRPEESDYEGMPASAISTGLVDLVLAAAAIPAELVRLRTTPSPLSGDGDGRNLDLEGGLAEIFATLRSRTGHDFSQYRRSTILRRLDRRLRFNGARTLSEYCEVLQSSRTETQALLKDLLISVSSFFRDPTAFDALAALVPRLFEGKNETDTVRVWVVGCATGEEVYSIAMVLWDHAATVKNPPRLQLFATDIDEDGYKWARAGLYTAAAVSELTPDRLQRFFTKEPGGYRIAKFLRELVLFAGHNVLHDPPFSRMDLIACRNLFIYLQPAAQLRVLDTFHFAMNTNGLLFLGASESIGESGLFTAIGGGERLFRRNAAAHRAASRVTTADPAPALALGAPEMKAPESRGEAAHPRFSYGAQHVRMLEQYAPTSIVVDDRLEVVHMSAGADRFLHVSEGEPTRNVLQLARGDLRRALRTALHHAVDDGAASTRRVALDVDGGQRNVTIQVRPSPPDAAECFVLIVFEVESRVSPVRPVGESSAERELEEELRRTRDLLEATSIAHDRTVAELQTVNEELQSINEEQRAATEELETGREEIQSINEELTTINQEHQSTIEELKRTNADLQNLIESTEIGTIFIDRATRIRRFTPAVASIFNFVAADRGRPLSHITHRLRYDELADDVAQVLGSLDRIEREVMSDSGESYLVRINPYRSFTGTNEGAVLTFYDNTVQHRIRQELVEAKQAAEAANLAKGTFLSTLSHEFRTPLNAILGYADLLTLDGPLNDEQTRKIERIKIGGWHLADMIEEILSFAKLDSGHEEVKAEALDARTVAHEAGELCESAATAKGLRFVLDVPDERVDMTTDRGKARQILINLCGNAVKYTNAGEVRLRIGRKEQRVTFEVSDTGIGIEPGDLGRIFERFWQVDGGSTRAAGGLGIGLAAAREYARLLRGDVEVESEPGRGSTFRLTLPIHYDRR